MRHERLLVIATYPILRPRHGGQKRTRAIVEAYRTAFEHVKFVAVFHKASYPIFSEEDIPVGSIENLNNIDANPHAMDQIVGKSIDNDAHVRSFFAKMLLDYKPDIIHVEQVFLYDGLSILLKELNMSPVLVYGSQNIEHEMKASIYKNVGMDSRVAKELVASTRNLEERFSKQADLVVAVSGQDKDSHRKMGSRKIIVARNGIKKMRGAGTKNNKSKYKILKESQDISTLVTFIGSGHPPNYIGVRRLLGEDTSFMPKGSKIILGGGVSEYFIATYPAQVRKAFWKNVIATGELSEVELKDLIMNTDIFMLPILSGGGSNLKTAEAILANKKIVATKYAFRGFEEYLSLPNIFIADDKKAFKDEVRHAIASEFTQRTAEQQRLANTVRWEYCLAPMVEAVQRLAKRRRLKTKLWHYAVAARRFIRKLTKL